MKKWILFPLLAACAALCIGFAAASDDAPQPNVAMLTFDDGPSGTLTAELLNVLREEQVPATFFVCGYCVSAHPDSVLAIAQAGHTIGVHGETHRYMNRLTQEEIRTELRNSIDRLTELTGVRPHLFRPPGGIITPAVQAEAQSAGLELVMWDVDPEDWREGKRAEEIADSVLAQCRGDCVILLHELHESTVRALPIIIETLRARGYVFSDCSAYRS